MVSHNRLISILTKKKSVLAILASAIAVCLLVLGSIHAQQDKKTLILNGVPTVRVIASAEKTKKEELNESQQNEFRVLVTKLDNDYIWATRNGKRLMKARSGAYVYFLNPGGSGYIKIETLEHRMDPNVPYTYLEHFSLGLTTTTYWGTLKDFQDDP